MIRQLNYCIVMSRNGRVGEKVEQSLQVGHKKDLIHKTSISYGVRKRLFIHGDAECLAIDLRSRKVKIDL